MNVHTSEGFVAPPPFEGRPSTLDERIRRARAQARFTQTVLAERLGVRRSAVAQWESRDGSRPSMDHLIALAIHTRVRLEWLGTGRGPMAALPWEGVDIPHEQGRVSDPTEMQCLCMLRKLPRRLRHQILGVLRAMVP